MTRLLEDDCLTRYREMLRVDVSIPLDAQQALIVHIDGLEALLATERAAVRRQAQTIRAMREWQPIDTAPRGGVEFVAYIPSDGENFAEFLVLHDGSRDDKPFWTTFMDDKLGHNPTHWRALEAPDPSTAPGTEDGST